VERLASRSTGHFSTGKLHLARLSRDSGRPVDDQWRILTLTTIEHLHYGSDYPFTPELAAATARERLAERGDPPGSVLDALRASTDRLFPALADRR
jgi:hypothetical protein